MSFPSTITSFSYPTSSDRLNNPSHSTLENLQSSAIGQIQAFIGTNASAVGTLMYDIRSPDSNGGGHVQSANKGGTGQTSYAKGDILVASSSSVLTKLSVGADGANLVADSTQAVGMSWVGSSGYTQSFISSGTWTKPTGGTTAFVEVWGGGGSGGARAANNGNASGGGGGAYNYRVIPVSMLGSTEQVTVGAGGASVIGSTNGNPGGFTVFGASSWVSAFGGGGGGTAASGYLNGGSGGGQFSAGGLGTASQPVYPATGSGSILTTVVNPASIVAIYSGGGAWVDSGNTEYSGGATVFGGGGGSSTRNGGITTRGGFSQSGGNGGGSSVIAAGSVLGASGAIPGGGGGAGLSISSGDGANGMVRVTIV